MGWMGLDGSLKVNPTRALLIWAVLTNIMCHIHSQNGEPSDCAIPKCGAARGAFSTVPPICPTSEPVTKNKCHKVGYSKIFYVFLHVFWAICDKVSKQEEFSCLDGSCVSKDYVCDGELDCDGGEDERDCRRIALLFAKEEGFRLQGGE